MKIEIVNMLDGDRPQYRIGDAVLARHHAYGRRALDSVASAPHLFEGSVLYEYSSRIDRNNTGPQWAVINDIVFNKSRRLGIEWPRKDELVIHLRMGDRKGFKLPAEVFFDYIMGLVNGFQNPIEQVTLVTALHFGKGFFDRQTQASGLSNAVSGNLKLLRQIIDLFSDNNVRTRLYSHDDIDRDFCFLANSKNLVLGNGHFSLCAAMISDAKCFVPPWARNDFGDHDSMLKSRHMV